MGRGAERVKDEPLTNDRGLKSHSVHLYEDGDIAILDENDDGVVLDQNQAANLRALLDMWVR